MTKVYWEKDIKSAHSKILNKLTSEIVNHEDIIREIKVLLIEELNLEKDAFRSKDNPWHNKAQEILLEFYKKQYKFYEKSVKPKLKIMEEPFPQHKDSEAFLEKYHS